MVDALTSLVGRRSAASVLMVATLAAMALIIALSVFANDAEAAYARRQLKDDTDGYWGTTTGNVATVSSCFVLLFIFGYGGLKTSSIIAADVVEEMSEDAELKKVIGDALLNAGVVSALVLSIVIGQMQVESPTDPPTIAWDVYVGCCFLSAGFSVEGVVSSCLGVMYTQHLTERQCRKFFLQMPHVLGFPISCMIISSLQLILQSVMYVSLVTEQYMPIYTGIAGSICLFNILSGWAEFSKWQNTDIDDETRKNRFKDVVSEEKSVTQWLAAPNRNPNKKALREDVGPSRGEAAHDMFSPSL
jgi:hypothetical protein